ncbi:MAG: hypothetical protein A2086_12780 [Spirochaetes bacterium GWD1_27_9]|nr:MAG: hypothetical protein A2Z98_17955 [Spirochaetes bacterium GWB1_27_13]OHD24025.1 MAG: hypothetical protein A2Y34_13985 [Spirochaetes bacterium GWC1_27_15]OHD43953.1 MAG: hypothetical protein A2086_12780 [Spirochaetes bacterium GWD1_27_9]
MNFLIRNESINEFNKIALITQKAFEINFFTNSTSLYTSEVLLVDLLRHYKSYDNDLCLVALVDNEIVGHIMFTPFLINLYGKQIKSVCLAPVSVKPEFQKKGIGFALIEEGHKIAKSKGYKFSFLLGHETYYPKFGYKTNMFGDCGILINKKDYKNPYSLKEIPIEQKHIPQLISFYNETFCDINLSLIADDSIIEWKSITPFLTTSILLENDNAIGYIRYTVTENNISVKSLVSDNGLNLNKIFNYLFSKNYANKQIKIPIHPNSKILNDLNYIAINEIFGAAMIKILDENCQEIVKYCDEVKNDKSKAGLLNFPIILDMV